MLHAILLAATLGLVAGLTVFLVGRMARASLLESPAVRHATRALPLAARLENRLEARQVERREQRMALETEVARARQHRHHLQKAVQDAQRAAQAPVRLVGVEGVGLRFSAWLINRQVQGALIQGKEPAILDPDWASPQLVEVWSGNLTDARREVQRHYPPPLGYAILSLQLETDATAPVRPADATAPALEQASA